MALMEEDWEEAAAAEAVADRVASDTARFLPETTPLLLAAAAKATEAAEVAASSDSSDEEGMESDARSPPEGVASYDDDYEFDDEEEEEVHAITALRAQALAAAADQGEDGVAMGFLSLRRTSSTDEVG